MTTNADDTRKWNQVRDRLAQIEAGLERSFAPDQEVIDEVYRRRARQLAEPQTAEAESSSCAVLVFGLGAERYAIELSALAEVLPYRGCTSVPGVPSSLLGVISVRGEIRPVADLRQILELQPGDGGAAGYVLMLYHEGRALGLKVDTIDQVRVIDSALLTPVNDGAAGTSGSRVVKGLTADAVILIDTNAALSQLDPASDEADMRWA